MSEHDNWTPAHLRQLDQAAVEMVVAKLRPMHLGYGAWLEIEAFAETRTIHDGRRVLNLLRFMGEQPDQAEGAAVMSSAIAELEAMLPKDG